MNEPKLPQSFSEQLLGYADSYRQQARELRAQNILANPLPNSEADRLEALADKMTTQAIESDAANEAARVKANLDKWVGDHKAIADWHNENTRSLISMSQAAIRLQVTINAGAAVALLAFLGNAINKNAPAVAVLFQRCFGCFRRGGSCCSSCQHCVLRHSIFVWAGIPCSSKMGALAARDHFWCRVYQPSHVRHRMLPDLRRNAVHGETRYWWDHAAQLGPASGLCASTCYSHI